MVTRVTLELPPPPLHHSTTPPLHHSTTPQLPQLSTTGGFIS
ncbi:hypothetical protein [Mastigocladopsis repens]|nr:hypothetical protein [Mastigocladopsis repens]